MSAYDPKNPWGQRPSSPPPGDGDGRQPDLDDMLRQAQNHFKSFRGGSPGAAPFDMRRGLWLFLTLLVLLWLATGFYRVEPEENAVILTFGKWTGTRTNPGLGYCIPYPVQEVV